MTTKDMPNGVAFELSAHIVGLERQTGHAVLVERSRDKPWRIDGYTIESSALAGPPRHGGEMHPDADEFLYLASGRIRVRLELEEGDRETELRPGQALVIPRGTWHQIFVDEPGQLINVTPGPGGQHRPLPEN
ncbi:MAG TPA: cupin domain-containing protein [Streptosporangiaceae bacterium]|nr:cupin domain-containing protein [Streptosporangiaceae bacterium]